MEQTNGKIGMEINMLQSETITWNLDISSFQLALNLTYQLALGTFSWQAVHGWMLMRPEFIPQTFDYDESQASFDGVKWTRNLSVKMHFAIADNYIRQERSKIHDNDDQVECIPQGTCVLMFHNQPKQTCNKLYQAWRGNFAVKRFIVKDIVFPEQLLIIEHIVHRSRLRPLVSPAVEESSNKDMSAEYIVPAKEPEEAQLVKKTYK